MADAMSTQVRALLAARAFVFDDPGSYMAGVDEALDHIAGTATRALHGSASTRPGPDGEPDPGAGA